MFYKSQYGFRKFHSTELATLELMFIIYVNDITSASNYFYLILYADSTTLCATLNSNYSNFDTDRLNNELTSISNWLKVNKLSLNVSKTKAMLFHTPQRNVNSLELCMDRLKWNSHIDLISKKVAKTLGIMKKLKKTVPSYALMNIYNALILSYLNYGIIIWGGKHNKLFKLPKKAIRIITKSRYNAHTSPLFNN